MTQDRESIIQHFADRPPLGYADYGDPQGTPVLAFHGTPGSRFKFRSTDAPARKMRLRILALDRRGYGLSPLHIARPSLADWADDVRAFADAIGVAQFSVTGISGGGPYAAACAALLGKRVQALALVSPVGPFDNLVVRDAIGPFHRMCFLHLPSAAGFSWPLWQAMRLGLHLVPSATLRLVFLRGPMADKTILAAGDIQAQLTQTFREGLAQGVAGPLGDIRTFGEPWGFSLKTISARSQVWLGSKDGNVPAAAARDLAERIPGCTLRLIPDAGHLWICENFIEVLRWISEHTSPTAPPSAFSS